MVHICHVTGLALTVLNASCGITTFSDSTEDSADSGRMNWLRRVRSMREMIFLSLYPPCGVLFHKKCLLQNYLCTTIEYGIRYVDHARDTVVRVYFKACQCDSMLLRYQ